MSFFWMRGTFARGSRLFCVAGTAALLAGIAGCGMAASPQPPSLLLPRPVHDLTATRTGNRVSLHWTTPDKTMDRLKLKEPVQMRICRKVHSGPCETVTTMAVVPAKPASYVEVLPGALTAGPLQPMTYEVFAVNKHGRTAGPSNAATTLAGEAPPSLRNLSATMTERGVVLRWQPIAMLQANMTIRLQRTLAAPKAVNTKTPSGLPPETEPAEQTLLTSADADRMGTTLDASVLFNRKYRYVAERVTSIKVGTESIQVASAPSEPIVILARDTFAPAVPRGLAAVFVPAAMNQGTAEIDLSWSANTEPDLAQYMVYRRNVTMGTGARQIAPDRSSGPLVAPSFRDPNVHPGRTYAYSVVAVDDNGNRSTPSAEVLVTVPNNR